MENNPLAQQQDFIPFNQQQDQGERRRDDRGSRDSRRDDKAKKRSRSRSRERRDRDSDRSKNRDRGERSEREKEKDRGRRRSRSPTPPRPRRRKPSQWDIAPKGFHMVHAPALPSTTLNPHQSRQSRRLYIGNLPPGISDAEISAYVNETLTKSGKTKNGNTSPVIAVQLNPEKNFAFVEFAHPEDTNLGMNLDGQVFRGLSLKVRRPKDWRPDEISSNPTSVPSGMEGPNKVYIGGLPTYINEEQVKELLSSFGELKSFNFIKDQNTGQSKGYAFFEYADTEVIDKACAGLNGMKLGEKNIIVQRASVGAKQTQAATNPYPSSLLQNPTALNFLNLGMPIAAACALLGVNINEAGPPTRVIQIGNMLSPEDVEYEEDYLEVEEEVTKEASKYGTVISVWIPRHIKEERELGPDENGEEKPRKYKISWGFGRIFVEYKRKEDAKRAQEGFAGRKFCNRQIVSGFFSEERYAMKNFEPDLDEERDYANRIARQFGHDPEKDLSEEIPDDV